MEQASDFGRGPSLSTVAQHHEERERHLAAGGPQREQFTTTLAQLGEALDREDGARPSWTGSSQRTLLTQQDIAVANRLLDGPPMSSDPT